MKRIYIYFPKGHGEGEEYSQGATAELSETPSGEVFAFMSSSQIETIWCEFQKEVKSHAIKGDSAYCLWGDLILVMRKNTSLPFSCYRRINDTQWACTERCIVGNETALEIIRG